MIKDFVKQNFKGILNADITFNKDRNVIVGNSGAGKSTIIEAMRSGCIATVSDARHGSLDAITDGENGIIVKQGSANAIVNALTDIIQYPDKYKHLYKASYDYYKTHLTRDIWKSNMSRALNAPSSHTPRQSPIDISRYTSDCNKLHRMIRGFWFRDRLHQFYHFLAFRWIRYCG